MKLGKHMRHELRESRAYEMKEHKLGKANPNKCYQGMKEVKFYSK